LKPLIGLGCSWTQGEGGYPDELWKQYNGKINLSIGESTHLIPIEKENSWVNVLCKDYLTDYTPINLGQRGIGNRASAKSLYLTNINWKNVSDGIVVFMLSGLERFDFFKEDWRKNYSDEFSEHKLCSHYNFQTLWPHLGHQKIWNVYAKHVYSEAGTAAEQLSNILEVQTFCKAHNLKFVFANAFDDRGKDFFFEHCGQLAEKIDWSAYIHDSVEYKSFVELLVKNDSILPAEQHMHYYEVYKKLSYPAEHLTNCIHPTVKGYKLIAKEIYQFIQHNYKIC
jgi:hypothetical protein